MATLTAVGLAQSSLPAPLAQTSSTNVGNWITGHKDEITAFGVVLAAVALGVNAWAARLAARTAKWNSTRDILWKFNEKWEKLYDSRVKADQVLTEMTKTHAFKYDGDLAEVLNHFDSMAFMGNRGHLDKEMAWSYYFEDAAKLWNRAIPYIAWRRTDRNDWTLWYEYEPWIKKLSDLDKNRRVRAKPHEMRQVEISQNQ